MKNLTLVNLEYTVVKMHSLNQLFEIPSLVTIMADCCENKEEYFSYFLAKRALCTLSWHGICDFNEDVSLDYDANSDNKYFYDDDSDESDIISDECNSTDSESDNYDEYHYEYNYGYNYDNDYYDHDYYDPYDWF